jgi:hypothetical protein
MLCTNTTAVVMCIYENIFYLLQFGNGNKRLLSGRRETQPYISLVFYLLPLLNYSDFFPLVVRIRL